MKIYFIGISGVMMGSLAVAMKNRGYHVRGSDKGFYPPMSTFLKENGIVMDIGYKAEHITPDIDIAISGAGVLPKNPEIETVKKYGIKHYDGYGKFLDEYFKKDQTLVVAGTYGKTTATAFIAHMLTVAKMNPTFAIGGLPKNFSVGVGEEVSDNILPNIQNNNEGSLEKKSRPTKTKKVWAIFEGDEYINSRSDQVPRFLYYHPTHLILTSVKYDHIDVYPTENSYIQAFKDLVALTPKDALVIASKQGENISEVLNGYEDSRSVIYVQTVPDPTTESGLRFISYEGGGIKFGVKYGGKECEFTSFVIGEYVIQDIVLGIAFGLEIGLDEDTIKEAVSTFNGVKRRLDIISSTDSNILVIDDLAHSPVKAQATLDSIKKQFPDRRILAVFEPHTLSARMKSSLKMFEGMFIGADRIYIAPVYHPMSVKEEERITSSDIAETIGNGAIGYQSFDDLRNNLKSELKDGDILVFMSSGAIGGLIKEFSGI